MKGKITDTPMVRRGKITDTPRVHTLLLDHEYFVVERMHGFAQFGESSFALLWGYGRAVKPRTRGNARYSRAGETEQTAPAPEPQVVDDQVDRRTQVIDAHSALTDGVFGVRCQTWAVLLDEEKRLLRREKTWKKTEVTSTRRALLVVIGQHRPVYEIERLLDALESCVSAALDQLHVKTVSTALGTKGRDRQCDKVDSDMEAIEQH